MNKGAKIYIAGHRGMVGSAIVRKLQSEGYSNFVLRTSEEVDLRDQKQVEGLFHQEQPEYVIVAAAHVGGILANNTYRAEFIYDNIMIEANVIHYAYLNDVKKLLFLGSSCIYPKLAKQPLTEDQLLTGPLEATNEPYAIAKIAGIKLCDAYRSQYGCNFISAMPTNLYGPNDNYDLETSHVLPALMRKFIEARRSGATSVVLWGSGTPRREFMHVDDLADACLFLMSNFDEAGFINVGTGIDIPIRELAEKIKRITRYEGEIVLDKTKPDGTPRKVMDVSKINNLGWQANISLNTGLEMVYNGVKDKVWDQ